MDASTTSPRPTTLFTSSNASLLTEESAKGRLLAGGLRGIRRLLAADLLDRGRPLADHVAGRLGTLPDSGRQRARGLHEPDGELAVQLDRALHDIEVALDGRDQVNLRQPGQR